MMLSFIRSVRREQEILQQKCERCIYDSAYIDGVITVFMILCSESTLISTFCCCLKTEERVENEELRVYLGVVAAAIATSRLRSIY